VRPLFVAVHMKGVLIIAGLLVLTGTAYVAGVYTVSHFMWCLTVVPL
jgi:hypothetical protein